MSEAYQAELAHFQELTREFGGVDSYTTEQAVQIIDQIFQMVREQGLDPENRAEFFEGICRIFHIQFVNHEVMRVTHRGDMCLRPIISASLTD